MKPHEETWEIVDGTGIRSNGLRVARFKTEIRSPSQAGRLRNTSPGALVEADYARARLAAQAPAMARLLLKLEWSNANAQDGATECPDCGNGPVEGHSKTCDLATVLRDAGVLP